MRCGRLGLLCALTLCAPMVTPNVTLAQRAVVVSSTESGSAAIAEALAAGAPTPIRRAIDEMHRSSATFRRQCLRLAAAQRVHISMHFDPRLTSSSWRARTAINRRDGQVVSARVLLPLSLQAVELIAHELEHILEQIDGVDLPRHVDAGAVWKDGDGSFESARAIGIGRRVAQEVAARHSLVVRR
ncbi:MAG TPA: hypothetical protein VMF13_04225 [Luteitalea sp.]|nr:hypothetical protein [Luteitalea sp.]